MDQAAGVVGAADGTSGSGIASGAEDVGAACATGGEAACPLISLPPAILESICARVRVSQSRSSAGSVRQACRWLKAAYDNSNTHLCLGGEGGNPARGDPLLSSLGERALMTKMQQCLSALVLATPHLTSLRLPFNAPWLPWSTLMDICKPALPRLKRLTLWNVPNSYNSEDSAPNGPGYDDDDEAHGDRHPPPPFLRPLAAVASSLTHLDLEGWHHLDDLSSLSILTSLRHLNMRFTNIEDLTPLSTLSQLVSLDLGCCPNLTNLSPLTVLTSITYLVTGACIHLRVLNAPPSVITLHAVCCLYEDISALSGCSSLTHLELHYCHEIKNISALSGCSSLTRLILEHCDGITNVSALSGCAYLTSLTLSHCARIADISALSGCPSLTSLDLSHCTRITDITTLSSCSSLTRLNLQHCAMTDVSALTSCSSLTYLDLRNCIHPIDSSALRRRSSFRIVDDKNTRFVPGPRSDCDSGTDKDQQAA